jgi:hypothetical protein
MKEADASAAAAMCKTEAAVKDEIEVVAFYNRAKEVARRLRICWSLCLDFFLERRVDAFGCCSMT